MQMYGKCLQVHYCHNSPSPACIHLFSIILYTLTQKLYFTLPHYIIHLIMEKLQTQNPYEQHSPSIPWERVLHLPSLIYISVMWMRISIRFWFFFFRAYFRAYACFLRWSKYQRFIKQHRFYLKLFRDDNICTRYSKWHKTFKWVKAHFLSLAYAE